MHNNGVKIFLEQHSVFIFRPKRGIERKHHHKQGRNHRRPRRWWAKSAPFGWNRVKASENLGATAVAPVAPVDTSLLSSLVLVHDRL